MSSKRVSKYRIYCETEQEYQYTWDETLPTTCPTNAEHSIDSSTITIIDTVDTAAVNINQEFVPTGGFYRAESKKVTVSGLSTEIFDYVWPYQLSVLTITLYSGVENEGDILNGYMAPDTVVGVLTENADTNDTVLHVNSTVIQYINIGFRVSVNNGSFIDLGECVAINKENNTITLENAISSNYTSGLPIAITVNFVKDFILRDNTIYELARKTIGGSSVAPGKVVRVKYTNNTVATKNFYFTFDCFY